MKHLIDKLRSNRRLDAEEYKAMLLCRDTELAAYLQELAREEALARFGNKIFIRGLIEITNRCRNRRFFRVAMKAIGWASVPLCCKGAKRRR